MKFSILIKLITLICYDLYYYYEMRRNRYLVSIKIKIYLYHLLFIPFLFAIKRA